MATRRMNGPDTTTVDGFNTPQLIVKSDTVTNVRVDARVLIVLTEGTLSVLYTNGVTLPFGTLLAGTLLPCEGAQRVNSTGSVATVADAL